MGNNYRMTPIYNDTLIPHIITLKLNVNFFMSQLLPYFKGQIKADDS